MELINLTGNPAVDRILQGLLDLFGLAFPGRICSVFLVGSRAAGPGSATPSSDIDVRIIFRDDFIPGELERFFEVRKAARALCSLGIDCPPLSETRLLTEEWLHEVTGLKTMSLHLWGEDLRITLPDPSLNAFTRNVTAAPIHFISKLHKLAPPFSLPLDYPDPEGEFYGYNLSELPSDLPDGSLKMLVHVTGFMASCRLAIEAGQIIGRKEDWLPAYSGYIHDNWLPYLAEIYTRCKQQWQYQIPEGAVERSILRRLCQQTLAFENDYLTRYVRYLEREIGSGEAVRKEFARKRMSDFDI